MAKRPLSLSANPTKWSNTPKRFVGKFTTNCLSVFDHFVVLAFKRLSIFAKNSIRDILKGPEYVSRIS